MSDNTEIEGLLMARRLANFCPTSLSLENIPSALKTPKKSPKRRYIRPSQSGIQAGSESELDLKSASKGKEHIFGFLLEDIKQVSVTVASPTTKIKYDLENVKRVVTPVKGSKPISFVDLDEIETKEHEEEEQK